MAAHGPLHMRAYHQWAEWFHGGPGTRTYGKAGTHMFSPGGSIDAWADPCPAPLVLYRWTHGQLFHIWQPCNAVQIAPRTSKQPEERDQGYIVLSVMFDKYEGHSKVLITCGRHLPVLVTQNCKNCPDRVFLIELFMLPASASMDMSCAYHCVRVTVAAQL